MKRLKEMYQYIRAVIKSVAITILIMPPICALVTWILEHFYHINFMVAGDDGKTAMRLFGPAWYLLLLKFLIVGCAEEGAFRYMLQDNLFTKVLKFPKMLSLIVASCIFGAAHLFNPAGMPFTIPQAVGAAFAGAWFGYLYENKGLHFAILVHGLYDFVIVMSWMYLHVA